LLIYLASIYSKNLRTKIMTSAVIVSTARTPLAKSWKGSFNMTHGATLGGHAVEHAVKRAGIEGVEVDDVIMGCANPEGATGANIARQVALRAGLPITTSGMTVNRFCSSGLQTIALAAQRIIAGEGDIYVAGGVESISCVQQEMNTHMLADSWLVKTSQKFTGTCCKRPSKSQNAMASAAKRWTSMVQLVNKKRSLLWLLATFKQRLHQSQ
jgi:acetyl-CoA acetyltransferase